MRRKQFVLAGVSFPCGAPELGAVASHHGYVPWYLEHEKFLARIEKPTIATHFCDTIPDRLKKQEGLFFPILESWVTQGVDLTKQDRLQFDSDAGKLSRSKFELSRLLEKCGHSFVPRRLVTDELEASVAAKEFGYPVVIRSDGGYSGRAIWIVNSAEELKLKWKLSQSFQQTSAYSEMKTVLGCKQFNIVIEPFFESKEWSVDFIISPDHVLLIRVTEKATLIVDDGPLCSGYRIIDCTKTHAELVGTVSKWARDIFEPRSISFGCFDIRRNEAGELVPLDFGARLGGNLVPHLVQSSSGDRNPYAAALDAAFSKNPSKMQSLREGAAIIHLFGKPQRALESISPKHQFQLLNVRQDKFEGHKLDSKRSATLLSNFSSSSEFLSVCRQANASVHEFNDG